MNPANVLQGGQTLKAQDPWLGEILSPRSTRVAPGAIAAALARHRARALADPTAAQWKLFVAIVESLADALARDGSLDRQQFIAAVMEG